jgi:phosphoribosylformimino-5-aminoimidazole carboxamide ribotide isomerase
MDIARAFRDVLGFRELYLADLDAICGGRPDQALYRALQGLQLDLWIDAGLKTADDLESFYGLARVTIVVGLETVSGAGAVREILNRAGPDRVMMSLDLFEGTPKRHPAARWPSTDPAELARKILEIGVRKLLLLDLSRVGTGRGTGTEELLAQLRQERPDAQISVGGGISGTDEVLVLRNAGAKAVLLGSALHDGRIGPKLLATITAGIHDRHSNSAD